MKTDRSEGVACNGSASLAQVAQGMRRSTLATLEGVVHDARLAGEEARHARSAGELAALHMEWAVQQLSRGEHVAADLLRGWLGVQSVWWRGFEQAMRAGLRPWLVARPASASAIDADVAWPRSLAELMSLGDEVRDAIARAWMSALDHDLRPSR